MVVRSASPWSVVTVLTPGRQRPDPHGFWNAIIQSDPIYLEVAMGVTVFVLAGRYFEASARAKAASALRELATRGAREVSVLVRDGSELRIPVGELREEQLFVVRPGETIATDGIVESGSAFVDNSAMTGESRPVPAGQGDLAVRTRARSLARNLDRHRRAPWRVSVAGTTGGDRRRSGDETPSEFVRDQWKPVIPERRTTRRTSRVRQVRDEPDRV